MEPFTPRLTIVCIFCPGTWTLRRLLGPGAIDDAVFCPRCKRPILIYQHPILGYQHDERYYPPNR